MIKISNLYFSFAKEYFTLNDINFDLGDNEKIVIVGNKNSGKTSLIRVILGLDKFKKGEVLVNNIPVQKINFKTDIFCGYVPTNPPFLINKSIENNFKYTIKLRTKQKDLVAIKLNNILCNFNLFGIKDVKIKQLNNFDKLKVAIVRLFLRDLNLLIIDDIFNGLSVKESNEIIDLIKQLIKQNDCASLIFVEDEKISNSFGFRKYYLEYGTLSKEKKKD